MSQAGGGQWPAHMSLHINVLELLSVWRVIQHFFVLLLYNQHVLIRTDNKAAAAYINRQGGVRSAQLLHTPEHHTQPNGQRSIWCVGKSLDPITVTLPHMLSFLQLLLDRNWLMARSKHMLLPFHLAT